MTKRKENPQPMGGKRRGAGAPKGNVNATRKPWTVALRHHFGGKLGAERLQNLVDKIERMALDGDLQAFKEIFDRVEGKASIIVGGDEERPLVLADPLIVKVLDATDSE